MAAQAHAARDHSENSAVTAVRTVIVIDRDLPKGLAANAAAVLAHGFGSRLPAFVGADFEDAAGSRHAGLIPTGVPVLAAAKTALPALRAAAVESGLVVVDFPAVGQQTTDYETFRAAIAGTEPADPDVPRRPHERAGQDCAPAHGEPRPPALSSVTR